MRLLIVESQPDPASRTLAAALESLASWNKTTTRIGDGAVRALQGHPDVLLVRIPQLHLHAGGLTEELERAGASPGAVVFLSKHQAASGRPSLTVHPMGNWTEARYGGQPGRLSPAAPALQSELLRGLARHAGDAAYDAEVTFEATHHGPLTGLPACFLELGSGPAQWTDERGARVVAEALLEVASRPLPEYPVAVGLGGGHYAPRFTEAALTRRVHFAHLIPTHAAEAVEDPRASLREALRQSPGAAGVYLHRKSIPRPARDRWRDAMRDEGVSVLESHAWGALEPSRTEPA